MARLAPPRSLHVPLPHHLLPSINLRDKSRFYPSSTLGTLLLAAPGASPGLLMARGGPQRRADGQPVAPVGVKNKSSPRAAVCAGMELETGG